MVVGVSFVATSAKFLAPDVPLPHLLEVGQATFTVFGWIEGVLCVLLLAAIWNCSRSVRVLGACVALLVLLQHVVLRPVLDTRLGEIVAGRPNEPSPLHHVYGAIEVSKVLVLAVIAILARNRVSRTGLQRFERRRAGSSEMRQASTSRASGLLHSNE